MANVNVGKYTIHGMDGMGYTLGVQVDHEKNNTVVFWKNIVLVLIYHQQFQWIFYLNGCWLAGCIYNFNIICGSRLPAFFQKNGGFFWMIISPYQKKIIKQAAENYLSEAVVFPVRPTLNLSLSLGRNDWSPEWLHDVRWHQRHISRREYPPGN